MNMSFRSYQGENCIKLRALNCERKHSWTTYTMSFRSIYAPETGIYKFQTTEPRTSSRSGRPMIKNKEIIDTKGLYVSKEHKVARVDQQTIGKELKDILLFYSHIKQATKYYYRDCISLTFVNF